MWSRVSVICILLYGVSAQTSGDVRVTIAQGDVVGSRASDGEYYEFYGIPYADSTSGRNRFKAPSAPPSFNDIFVANRKDVKCVRALGIGFDGTEDCLVVNVFTPNVTEPLPVMVWIKGREFDLINAPDLSLSNFMRKDVVVVSLNYRESILGFLCLGTDIAPGNAGLKDIIAGLKWVRENIAEFGGDPQNINLFGHGSGAAAVDLVSLSPMSEGLVTRVITQSGNALSPWAVTRDNIRHAVEVAEALGHEVTDIIQLSEVFTRTSLAALMAVINELNLTDNSLAFAPCLENESLEDGDPFLVRSPYEILLSGEYTALPFITGFVDKEGTIRAEEALEDNWLEKMDDSFADFIQSDLIFESEDVKLAVVDKIRTSYFDDQPIDSSTINEFLSYHGDTMILVSTLREVRMRAATSSSPIYLYQFSYKGYLGEPFTGPLSVDTVAHSEELGYLFRDYNNNDEINDIDIAVSDILIERWTNFAKTGIPESDTSQVPWLPFTSDNSAYIRILDRNEISSREEGSLEIDLEDPHPKKMSFWDEIYEEHFLDAEGRWDLTERDEGDDDGNDENGGEDGNGEDEGNGNGEEDGGNGDGEGEDGGNGDGGEEDGGNGDGGEDGGNGDGGGEDGGNGDGGEDGGNGDGGEDGGNGDGGGDGGNGDGGGEDGGNGDGGEDESNGEDDENGDGDNSATTAVGYTFLITSLFAILGNLHMSRLVS